MWRVGGAAPDTVQARQVPEQVKCWMVESCSKKKERGAEKRGEPIERYEGPLDRSLDRVS